MQLQALSTYRTLRLVAVSSVEARTRGERRRARGGEVATVLVLA